MRSFCIVVLLAFVAPATAEDVTFEDFVDRLAERALPVSESGDMDETTLGKTGAIALPSQTAVQSKPAMSMAYRPSPRTRLFRAQPQQQEIYDNGEAVESIGRREFAAMTAAALLGAFSQAPEAEARINVNKMDKLQMGARKGRGQGNKAASKEIPDAVAKERRGLDTAPKAGTTITGN